MAKPHSKPHPQKAWVSTARYGDSMLSGEDIDKFNCGHLSLGDSGCDGTLAMYTQGDDSMCLQNTVDWDGE